MIRKKPYWFKVRRYGYGWVPVTWQGWMVIIVFLALTCAGMLIFLIDGYSEDLLGLIFIAYLGILVTGLVIVSSKTGPKPRWRWGKKPDDDPETDW